MSLIDACFRRAIAGAEDGDPDARVTLEAIDDPGKWVQLSFDTINAAYPRSDDPAAVLSALSIILPEYVEVSEWQATQFVTFEHGAEPLDELTRFVEQYLALVLDVKVPDTSLRIIEEPE